MLSSLCSSPSAVTDYSSNSCMQVALHKCETDFLTHAWVTFIWQIYEGSVRKLFLTIIKLSLKVPMQIFKTKSTNVFEWWWWHSWYSGGLHAWYQTVNILEKTGGAVACQKNLTWSVLKNHLQIMQISSHFAQDKTIVTQEIFNRQY